MISAKKLKAFRIITDRIKGHKVDWVVIGSANLSMQGVKLSAHDIDILADKKSAKKMEKLLKEFVTEPLHLKKTKYYVAYRMVLNILGTGVEVLADKKNIIPREDLWNESKRFSGKIILDIKGMKIPAAPLEQEYFAYAKMGRPGKARKIKAELDRKAKAKNAGKTKQQRKNKKKF